VTLADLRKLAVRKRIRIRFQLVNGMECVIGADGVARVPALRRSPDFNLEQELASATDFWLDPLAALGPQASPPKRVSRAEVAALMEGPAPPAAHGHEED
jgi:hypothetical protein